MKKIISFMVIINILMVFNGCEKATDKNLSGNSNSSFNEAIETEAIMKVIDGETKCFFNGNYECWKSYWSHKSYVVQAWNNDDGTADVATGWDKINSRGKAWIEKYYKNGENIIHPTVKREKPTIKFYSDSAAYLTWKQYNSDAEKKYFRTSFEIRIMEKESTGWKIANVSAFWDTQKNIPFDSLKIN
ncbi:MAG: hypothetical protein HYS24_10525 [Ignavibacteriales bacterium]|nr:hypothetical protein [Ignavibacteriales bacterium]